MAARLNPKPEKRSFMEVYAPYFLIVCIIILVFLIIAALMVMAGVHGFQLTGTEANLHQNMNAII